MCWALIFLHFMIFNIAQHAFINSRDLFYERPYTTENIRKKHHGMAEMRVIASDDHKNFLLSRKWMCCTCDKTPTYNLYKLDFLARVWWLTKAINFIIKFRDPLRRCLLMLCKWDKVAASLNWIFFYHYKGKWKNRAELS